jgi:hypothetical protein
MPLPLPDPVRVLEVAWKAFQSGRQAVAVRDHATLYRGRYANSYSNVQTVYTVVACAPSWPLQRPHPVHPTRALEFLEAVFPGRFSLPPTQSYGDAIAFDVWDDPKGWSPIYGARIYSHGLVEFLIRVPTDLSTESLTLRLVDCVEPWYRVASSVRAGAYRDLFGFRTRARRIDWFFALSSTVSHPERGSAPWDDLVFPGRRPATRATDNFPGQTRYGFAFEELRGRRQRTDPLEIVGPALRELLVRSGWIDLDEATADALAELRSTHRHPVRDSMRE